MEIDCSFMANGYEFNLNQKISAQKIFTNKEIQTISRLCGTSCLCASVVKGPTCKIQ
jgi:hypothetical protein